MESAVVQARPQGNRRSRHYGGAMLHARVGVATDTLPVRLRLVDPVLSKQQSPSHILHHRRCPYREPRDLMCAGLSLPSIC